MESLDRKMTSAEVKNKNQLGGVEDGSDFHETTA